MKIQISVTIPDGDYCKNCQFLAITWCEEPICTLFSATLETACEHYRSLHGGCDDMILCCDCPNIDNSEYYAKCDECKETILKQKIETTTGSEISDDLKEKIKELNEGLFWIAESGKKSLSAQEIREIRELLEKAYYLILNQK